MKSTLLFVSILSFSLNSCGEKSTKSESHEETHASENSSSAKAISVTSSNSTSEIIEAYLAVKDALVNDNQPMAYSHSNDLVSALKKYDSSTASADKFQEVQRLQAEATGFSEKLANGNIASQRESFQSLSLVLKEMLKITGSDRPLYHQYCPMYNKNQGGMWLSANEEIKNPLFGSSMLTCGRVVETLKLN
ncbi:DUF3347 domain-containing protein [Algoriphagus sp.]|uniref:DUF3347 domain-containing protein n=1 Tax=Algoriphagus sp. TaxID=1872435 RepID=UPI00391D45D2